LIEYTLYKDRRLAWRPKTHWRNLWKSRSRRNSEEEALRSI